MSGSYPDIPRVAIYTHKTDGERLFVLSVSALVNCTFFVFSSPFFLTPQAMSGKVLYLIKKNKNRVCSFYFLAPHTLWLDHPRIGNDSDAELPKKKSIVILCTLHDSISLEIGEPHPKGFYWLDCIPCDTPLYLSTLTD